MARHTLRVTTTVCGVLLILIALFTATARLSLPLLSNYKAVIESRVSDFLGSPVTIGELVANWEGVGPLLRAQQVVLLESGQRLVRLEELLIDLNLPLSLWRGLPVIDELTLVGAELSVEVDIEGRWRLRGVNAGSAQREAVTTGSSDKQGSGGVMAWVLRTGKVGLLESSVSIRDARSGHSLHVQSMNVRAENAGRSHQLRVEMDLPGENEGRLSAGIDLTGSVDSLHASSGDLYLKIDGLQAHTLMELLSISGLTESSHRVLTRLDGRLSAEFWGSWANGQLISVHGPLHSGPIVDLSRQSVVMQQIDTIVDVFLSEDSLTLQTSALDVTEPGGTMTRVEDLSAVIERRRDGGVPLWQIRAQGQALSMSLLQGLPASLLGSLRPALDETLSQAQARGWLRDWQVSIGRADNGMHMQAHASLDRLQWQAVAGVPGAGPFSGRVDVNGLEGELTLIADRMPLHWPAWTERELQVDKLHTVIHLDASDERQWRISADLALNASGIDTSTRIEMLLAPGQSPHLDAQVQYEVAELNALQDWLPRRYMREGLQRWFDRAIQSGQARDGRLLFFGKLSDFPFSDGEGVFQSHVDIRNGQIAFLPDWPVVRNLNGRLELNGLSLIGMASDARFDKFDITQTRLRIDDLFAAVLDMEGTASGQLQQVLDFANTGPLQSLLAPVLSDVTGSGNAALDLTLHVPLTSKRRVAVDTVATIESSNSSATATTRDNTAQEQSLAVNGSVFLSDNTLAFGRANMTLKAVQGAIGFDENGIRINNLRARALDQPVSINALTDGEGRAATTRVSIRGALRGNDVLAHYGSQLDQFLRGRSSWMIELTAPHAETIMAREGVQLRLTSDLVGTAILLPAPLGKSTAPPGQIEVTTALRPDQSRLRWRIAYQNKLAAEAVVGERALESLWIHFGATAIPAQIREVAGTGIHVSGTAETVAVDGWVDSIVRYIDSLPVGDGSPEPILPIAGELRVGSLQVGKRLLGPGSLRVDSQETYLNAMLESRSVRGQIRYPRNYWSKTVPVEVNLERLDTTLFIALASRDEGETPVLLARPEPALDPRLLPPIHARIDRLTHRQYTVNDLVVRTEPDVSGLRLTSLGFAHEQATLIGSGYWRLRDPQGVNPALSGQHLSHLDLTVQSSDFGRAMSAIGLHDVLSEGQGRIETRLSWPGPMYVPSIAQIDGSIELMIERGNIIPIEPQGGRMVGLLALQALPRRLEFDFKDVTADGLAFESITGAIRIENGLADAELVQLTGPIGVIDITGQSDIVNREFDQHITILPRVSAALPLIGVISGGATAGVGVLVAAGFLKALGIDFDRIGLRDYHLGGKWDDPVFEPVERDYRR